MASLALATSGIAFVVGAFVLDWRASLLMLAAWWADNMLVKLRNHR